MRKTLFAAAHTAPATPAVPATPAADADPASRWWRALSRQAWRVHLARAGAVAAVVVVVGAGVSVYLSVVGLRHCEAVAGGELCVATTFYPLTVQRRAEVVTVDGKRAHRTEWHRGGALWFEGSYDPSTGERTGLWREHYADGTPRFEAVYADDEITGVETWYYPSGKKEWEIGRLHGERDGEERWYHENGELRRIGTYKDGQRDGTFTIFDEDGRVAIKGEYKDGALLTGERID